MHRVLAAMLAELTVLQAVLEDLFVLATKVVSTLTNRTLKFDHVVLGHTISELK